MHTTWYKTIFSNIEKRLENSAMKLVYLERNGESVDSKLVIGVRESYAVLCSSSDEEHNYKDSFEKAYLDAAEAFYHSKSVEYLQANGVQNYMIWADTKLREEEHRGAKYLEPSSLPALIETCVRVLVSNHKDLILAECPTMIQNNETDSKKRQIYFAHIVIHHHLSFKLDKANKLIHLFVFQNYS